MTYYNKTHLFYYKNKTKKQGNKMHIIWNTSERTYKSLKLQKIYYSPKNKLGGPLNSGKKKSMFCYLLYVHPYTSTLIPILPFEFQFKGVKRRYLALIWFWSLCWTTLSAFVFPMNAWKRKKIYLYITSIVFLLLNNSASLVEKLIFEAHKPSSHKYFWLLNRESMG